MDPISADDPLAQSANLVAGNLQKLQDLFPEAFAEGKVDFDTLRQLLGDAVDDGQERYGLTWHGKRAARQLALTPSTGTLRPKPEESVEWDTTQNLMIEGDNLEVLKLLQKSYAGKVKLVYIDPPYNTGKDFVYKDDFRDSIRNYQEVTGQVEGGVKVSSNVESSGRFHTDWLSMMYPRLLVARDLLTQDGAILVSINDTEAPALRSIMNQVFGEENFVAQIVWTQGRKSISSQIATNHDYCIAYCRDKSFAIKQAREMDRDDWMEKKTGLDAIYAAYDALKSKNGSNHVAIEKGMRDFYKSLSADDPSAAHSHYKNSDNKGLYFADNISQGTGNGGRYDVIHPLTGEPCKVPSGGWRFAEAKMPGLLEAGRVHFGKDHETVPCYKRYLKETEYEVAQSVFYRDGRGSTKRLSRLMEAEVFDYPKDEEIIARFVKYVTSADDQDAVVMDFFAGSGTTGHAVMEQNAADGGSRRYILVQLPERLDPANKDQKAAADYCDVLGVPHTIAELTKERLRRAGEKVQEDHPGASIDAGFRVYALDSSNIQAWAPNRDDLAESLFDHIDNLVDGRTEQDVLAELLLKLGLDLCVPIETRAIAGHEVHSVGAGTLFACLPSEKGAITDDEATALGRGIAEWRDELDPAGDTTVVLRDGAFKDDLAKLNLTAALEQRGVERSFIRSL